MFSVNNFYRTSDLLGKVFKYGFDNHYSLGYIEEAFTNSSLAMKIEKGIDIIDADYDSKKYLEDVYKKEISSNVELDSLFMWIGEAYLRLFLETKKSFEYIMLYFPLEMAIEKYKIFHEMDFTQLFELFKTLRNEKTVLSKIIKKRSMTVEKLSELTGINVNTIKRYCKKEENLATASFDNVCDIANILDVSPNIFRSKVING